MAITVKPHPSTLGAEVTGVDLQQPLEDSTWLEIENAFNEHAVLVFPEQHLSDDQQIVFTRRFGALERLITKRAKQQEVGVLANLDQRGNVVAANSSLGLFLKGNTYWHTDSSFKRVPAKASLLSARVVPSAGGETEFADMRSAYDALDDDGKKSLEGLQAVHDYIYSQSLVGGIDVLSKEDREALPPVIHPVVRTHSATGRRNLYIGRHASHVVDMEVDAGRALLAELLETACQPPRTFLHRWQEGDLIAWDNRCVLHRGREWNRDEPRIMHRTTVAGEEAGNEWTLD